MPFTPELVTLFVTATTKVTVSMKDYARYHVKTKEDLCNVFQKHPQLLLDYGIRGHIKDVVAFHTQVPAIPTTPIEETSK